MAISMYYSTQRIDLQISFAAATWLRVFQVVGIGFLFVPITLVAYVGVPPEKNNAVSGLVNFMRNIGSGVGTSLVTTLVARRSQFHQEILAGYGRQGNFNLQNTANNLSQHVTTAGTAAPDSLIHAYAIIYQQVQAEATTLAYIDTFMVLAVMAGIMFFLSFLLKKNDPGGGGEVAVG
jgi:DHA2 family multidrug resistance protein